MFQSDLWQPAAIEYPDAEKALCDGTRSFNLGVDYIGREKPAITTTAIIWNRVGGRDPNALMQCRIYAPTAQSVTDLARALAARMRLLVRAGVGIVAVAQNTGPIDLGNNPGPMRQMLYEVTLRGLPVRGF